MSGRKHRRPKPSAPLEAEASDLASSVPTDAAAVEAVAEAVEPSPEAPVEPVAEEGFVEPTPAGDAAPMAVDETVPLESILEAILFASGEAIEVERLARALPEYSKEAIAAAIEGLVEQYAAPGRGLSLRRVAGGFRLETRPRIDPWLERFFDVETKAKLSFAGLETLAIIAFRQPVTLPEINEIRGVSSSGVVRTLLERKLVKIHGRKAVVGNPFLYRTTRHFLEHFGLASLADLPKAEELEQLLGEGIKIPGGPEQMVLPLDVPEDAEGDGLPVETAEAVDGSDATPTGDGAVDVAAAEVAE